MCDTLCAAGRSNCRLFVGGQAAKWLPRHNRLLLTRPLKFLAGAILCVIALADLRGQSGIPGSSSQGSRDTSPVLPATAPTYYRDVLLILRQHCVICHRAGGIAPMSFETYEAAARYAYLIRNVTHDKAMPPPFSVPLAGRVTNDPSLTPAQISTLAAWANLKAPAGDPRDAPAVSLGSAPWSIPKPDLVVRMPQPVSITATGNLDYVYQIVPTRFTEGHWIQMAEVLPSLPANLLQMMVVIRRPGSPWLRHSPLGKPFTSAVLSGGKDGHWADDDILVVYVPGSSPQEFPVTMGKFIPAGSDLVFRAQYAVNGTAGSDQSSVGLVFCKQKPSQRVVTLALDNDRFIIPPQASDYRVEARGVLQRDVFLVSFFPLLHLRGKCFEYDVIPAPKGDRHNPNPEMETLLRVNYDLRWQTSYYLSEPLFLKRGTQLRAVAWYDNSANNPRNPNSGVSVNWGDRPQDEMLGGYLDVAIPATIGGHKILVPHD
jgi:mono/diheme cytochrome c family protein